MIGRLARDLRNLDSSVIVAPMQAGKTFLARRVREEIRDLVSIVHFEFAARAAITTESEVFAGLTESSEGVVPGPDLASFFDSLRRIQAPGGRPIVLIISHLDALSRDLARRFLVEIRASVNDPDVGMAALITAESHVFDLLLGPHSEFNCAYEYMLQGFDLELFSAQMERLSRQFELRLDPDIRIAESLWLLTGGSIYLLRQCLLAWIDYRFSRSDTAPAHLNLETAELMADRLASPGPRECSMFRRIIEILDADPEYLAAMDVLISAGSIDAPPGPPHAFELSGLTYYHDGRLSFSSEMLSRFVGREFSAQRRGYLYALADQWDAALQRWGKRSSNFYATPSFYERVITQEVIRRLREKLKLTPGARADALFQDALGALFGVDAVHHCWLNAADQWVCAPELADQVRSTVIGLLDARQADFSGSGCIGASLSPAGPARESIIVLDGGAPLWLHRELKDLVFAYARSVREERQREAEKSLKHLEYALSDIVRAILNGLYVNLLSPADVLKKVLADLQTALDFEEADVWLFSEDGMQLYFVAAAGNSAPFQESFEHDASRMRTIAFNAGAETVMSAGVRAPATISLVLSADAPRQVGLLNIRFKLGAVVTDGEIGALKVFAGQLGAAVDHGRRILRINSALDSIVDPIIVLDRSGARVYSNSAGQRLSWDALEAEFRTSIGKALTGQRLVEFPGSVGGAPYEGTVVFQPLTTSRELMGVMVLIQPKSYYAHILNAALALERANTRAEALESLLRVFSSLGHRWIRMYRIEGDRLIPEKCLDPDRPHIAAAFYNVALPPRNDSPTWVAVNTRQPHVFAYIPEMADGECFVTPLGLTVIAQSDPPEKETLGKAKRDYWIDFPLMKGTEVIGKFTIPCGPNISPEQFQMFNTLTSIVGSSLSLVAEREAKGGRGSRSEIERVRRLQSALLDQLGPLEILREAGEEQPGDRGPFNFATYAGQIASALDQMRERIEQLDSTMERL